MVGNEVQVPDDDGPREGEVYRHRRRGTVYTVIGSANLQTEAAIGDNEVVVIYRGTGGELWARPVREFRDGRFEVVPKAPEPR